MKGAALRVSYFLSLREEPIGNHIIDTMPFCYGHHFIYEFLVRYVDILSFVAL